MELHIYGNESPLTTLTKHQPQKNPVDIGSSSVVKSSKSIIRKLGKEWVYKLKGSKL